MQDQLYKEAVEIAAKTWNYWQEVATAVYDTLDGRDLPPKAEKTLDSILYEENGQEKMIMNLFGKSKEEVQRDVLDAIVRNMDEAVA